MLNYYNTDDLYEMLKERTPENMLVPRWLLPIVKGNHGSDSIILYSVLLNQLLENFINNKELVDENDVSYIIPNNDEIEDSLNEPVTPFYKKLANYNLTQIIHQDRQKPAETAS